jgi:spore coat polysaccharide biosynthesis predicted glycosyltransferase SpsG
MPSSARILIFLGQSEINNVTHMLLENTDEEKETNVKMAHSVSDKSGKKYHLPRACADQKVIWFHISMDV